MLGKVFFPLCLHFLLSPILWLIYFNSQEIFPVGKSRGKWVNLRFRHKGRNRWVRMLQLLFQSAVFELQSPTFSGNENHLLGTWWQRLSEMPTSIYLYAKHFLQKEKEWACFEYKLMKANSCLLRLFARWEAEKTSLILVPSVWSLFFSLGNLSSQLFWVFFRNIKVKFFLPLCTLYSNKSILLE